MQILIISYKIYCKLMQHSIFLCTRDFLDVYVKEKKQAFTTFSIVCMSSSNTATIFFLFLSKVEMLH